MDPTRLEEIRQSELGLEFFPLARLEKNELLGHIDELTTKLDEYRKQFAEDQARINSLAAQVVALREALKACHPVMNPEEPCGAYEAWAGTEAAATAWLEVHDREQRLEGARELVRKAVIEVMMEREA